MLNFEFNVLTIKCINGNDKPFKVFNLLKNRPFGSRFICNLVSIRSIRLGEHYI